MSTLNKEGTFDRRGFVKGSMAAAAIMRLGTLAACSPTAKDESGVGRDPLSETGWDDSADVVVVGLGGGLGAVLSAAEAGVTVIGIEKLSMLGGNWAINSGIVFAPATDAMMAAGDKDERTGHYRVGGSRLDPLLQGKWRSGSGRGHFERGASLHKQSRGRRR